MDAPWMQVFLGLDGYEPAQACSSSSSHPLINGQEEAMDVEDAPRLEFLCPHCYSQFDIASLCSHLDDEHCFQSKPLLCPVCAAKVSDDLVGHITLQHGNLFKMHRRKRGAPRKSSEACSANLSLVLLRHFGSLGHFWQISRFKPTDISCQITTHIVWQILCYPVYIMISWPRTIARHQISLELVTKNRQG